MSDAHVQAAPASGRPATVGEVEQVLFEAYPRAWAEPWDRPGLMVGDPHAEAGKVAVALDATAAAVRSAAEQGATLLVTHHPVCLEMPDRIAPETSGAPLAAACIWEAVARGVACVAMHTNLDRSPEATRRLPALLGLDARCGIEAGRTEQQGRLGSAADLGWPVALGLFAERCRSAFGRVAQVYGDPSRPVRRAAFFTGSLGGCGEDALAAGCDVVVCGECGYHRALDLTARGCAVIILGHDFSELPLVDVLAERLEVAGVPGDDIVRVTGRPSWFPVDPAGVSGICHGSPQGC